LKPLADGVIAGWIAYVIAAFVSYSLFPEFPLYQSRWPGAGLYKRWAEEPKSMFVRVPGWNDHAEESRHFDEAQAAKGAAKESAV
jgi:hypothetical protein